ncbi:putative pyridoxal-dependent aspartate 1-decarboxylase [Glaciecola sp. MH2013]|uniref:pyridoxal-dependent aspartate 1-decarboxylase PanP n=1 Tax=Glaciecola sp. MH2013 TaxID=2785524 RepID=UPI00189E7B29|nr:putative pyridoxal-dependent aspartate 1-decarboxylase [Glaciecola sp. MH2013]MBF7071797.1 putative pyridoxal-dependent aspartate 1-decarboxylase [Glaciecola sp. MH2013]
MAKADVSLDHLFRVFTKPEHTDSTLAKIERHLSDNISDFLSQHVVTKKTSLEEIEKDFRDATVPDSPEFVSSHAESLLNKLVAHSVNTYAPTFIGHMTSALPYFHLSLAKLLVGLNQNLVKIETSKAFTPLERQTLGMMHNLIYQQSDAFYEEYLHSANDSLGSFCSGGTIANITALWVARNQLLCADGRFRGVAKEGLAAAYRHYSYNNIGIMSSSRGHYSLSKTVDVLGIGRDNMLTVHNASQCLEPKDALALGQKYQEQGNKLLAIVGVAGTTETGHVDPLDELADVAKELGCWFHVDAAWGGATLFSEQYRHKLAGIEKADSVTIDAHKQMYVPMGAGMALFKDPKHSNAVRHNAQYILREGSKDLGATTLEGSRNGMAMMVYSSLHILGRRGYELLINKSIELAKEFAQMIEDHPDFELVTSPILSLLTYRLRPAHLSQMHTLAQTDYLRLNEQLNSLTVSVQKQQREAGKSFVSRTRIEVEPYKGEAITVFRVVLANPLTTKTHLGAILDEQISLANNTKLWKRLLATEMPKSITEAAVLPNIA